MKRKIRMGMVGGGPGSFIGGVHRMAARLDGKIELVAGAFSRDPDKSRQMAGELFLPESRCYPSYAEMFARESELPLGERMDFVAVTTPNHTHFDIAMAALRHGFHVVCDKPMTFSLLEAKELQTEVRRTGLLFALTHNYSAYPMTRQMQRMIAEGKLGKLRKIVAQYDLGWLAGPNAGKQALWRTDPAQSGIAACVADIGTHAEHLIEFVTGLKIAEVSADLTAFVEGRVLDDDASILLRFEGGARGLIEASVVAAGEENRLRIRVYGETGSLEWNQQTPEELLHRTNSGPAQIIRRGWAGMEPSLACWTRLPAGHPEGFVEAFANLYLDFALAVDARLENRPYTPSFPGVEEGVRGMAFIEGVVESSRSGEKWRTL